MNIFGIALLLLQVQRATASGIVTKPGGTEPLSGATVTLAPAVTSQSTPARTTISEEDGRFTINDIEPGEYRLQIQSARYGGAAYGQRKPEGPGSILTFVAGQRLSDLKISPVPTGTIAGRITGRSGEPIAYATVQALKTLYQDGKRVLSVAQTAVTDDRGDYRLFWLTTGKYVVVAAPRSSPMNTGVNLPFKPGDTSANTLIALTQQRIVSSALLDGSNLVKRILEDGSTREESWLPTYYPSTTDRAQATPVDVTAGATVPGVNLSLGPSPVQRIRGRAVGFTTQATVALAPATRESGAPFLINRGASTTDGSFEFAGILPGAYYLAAQDRAGLVSAPVPVFVADRDVDNLTLTATQGLALSARITVEGFTGAPLDPLTGFSAALSPQLDLIMGAAGVLPGSARVGIMQPGSNVMTFQSMPPGDYQFTFGLGAARENLQRIYLKSIRLGSEDALGTVHVTSSTANQVLDVVLTTQTGSVEGVALGRAGDPAGNATVVLIPANARNRMSLYQAVVTGSDGRFRFQEIPPGDYKLFAWDDVETGAWTNREFVATYESRGRAVRVSENSKTEVPLSVIYNP